MFLDGYVCLFSTKEHYVNRKLVFVEERHSPMVQQNGRAGEKYMCARILGWVISTCPLGGRFPDEHVISYLKSELNTSKRRACLGLFPPSMAASTRDVCFFSFAEGSR